MTFSDLKAYQTPHDRLYLRATESIARSRRTAEMAVQKFVNSIIEDADLLVALIGRDRLDEIALQYLRDKVQPDMDGAGLPVKKTGSNAVADEKGQGVFDPQSSIAPSSAPHSETPAQPVGGGHPKDVAHAAYVSPSTNGNTTIVRSHERLLPGKSREASSEKWSPLDIQKPKSKAPYKAPTERVSADKQLSAKNLVASNILVTVEIRGKPIGKWRKEEAQELAEKMDWDAKVLKAFTDPIPPGALVEEYITISEAEQIMKKLEASRYAA